MFDYLKIYAFEILLALSASVTGWASHYVVRVRNPAKGISGPAFAHTMGNVNSIMVEQNKEIARLSVALTRAEEKIQELEDANSHLRDDLKRITEHDHKMEEQVRKLTEEVYTLLQKLWRDGLPDKNKKADG